MECQATLSSIRSAVSRRTFLRAAGAGAASVGLLGACSGDGEAGDRAAGCSLRSQLLPFRGDHQAGITAPPAAAGIVAGLDVRHSSRDELTETFQILSESIEQVMSGRPFEDRDGGFPPVDTGILGPEPGATGTSVVVGVGDSLFDGRFGLSERKPPELQPMLHFANDYLVADERSHGDLSLVIGADTNDAAIHALRQILRSTRGRITPRWTREGYNTLIPDTGPGQAPARNLMGFKDGTSNLDTGDDQVLSDHVWVGADDGAPDWAVGGSYLVIRVIRMMTEFWDRTRLNEQEDIFGRHRDSGAPLGASAETDTPDFDGNFESHIARANPRTPGSERNLILRRGFSYSDGLDGNDQLDQGLLFTCFQRSLTDGFIAVQRRLDGEALEEYIRPVGGGFFFAIPGPAEGEFLGQRLLA